MDKGWGLALDSDKRTNYFCDRMFSGVEFPVKPRPAAAEVNFFADKKNKDDHEQKSNNNNNTCVDVKKENRSSSDAVNTGLQLVTANAGSDQSTVDDGVSSDPADSNKRAKNHELGMLQVELQRMTAENQRLKEMLGQITNNYTALQMNLVAVTQQQQSQAAADQTPMDHDQNERKAEEKRHEIGSSTVPRQFLLCGREEAKTENEVSNSSSGARARSDSPPNHNVSSNGKRVGREESPESETQGWVPNKVAKPSSPLPKPMDQAAEATMRKARVSVRARSEAPMITDGCQWRKYGQKIAKGNPCPRAYYKCTMVVGCPVRKQVQRCADDTTILITTYEGNHNHPLPQAAMAMASTTTAAASMLLSGSMSSAEGIMNPNNFLARTILSCSSSVATISASAPLPTITLDLTTSAPLQFQRPQQGQFQMPFPGGHNFGSSSGSNPQMPQGLYNQSKFSGLQLSQELLAHQAQQHQSSQSSSFADTVSAATAAITADPSFTAALAAAITSIIGGSSNTHTNNNNSTNSNNNNGANNNKINNFPGN